MKRSAMVLVLAIGIVLGLPPLKAQAVFSMYHWHNMIHFIAQALVHEQRAGTLGRKDCLLVLASTGHPDFAVCNIGGTAKNFADTQFVTCINIKEEAIVGANAVSFTSVTCVKYPVGGATDASFAQGAYDVSCTGTVASFTATSGTLLRKECMLLNQQNPF